MNSNVILHCATLILIREMTLGHIEMRNAAVFETIGITRLLVDKFLST